MGVSPSTVSRIETDCSSTRIEQLQAYCNILDITLGELFACDANESKQRKISLSISLNIDSKEDLNRVYEAFKILGHQYFFVSIDSDHQRRFTTFVLVIGAYIERHFKNHSHNN